MSALAEIVVTSAVCGLIVTTIAFAVFAAFLRRSSAATQNYFWRALACTLVVTPLLHWIPDRPGARRSEFQAIGEAEKNLPQL